MKLEGLDPEHPSRFCVLTVAEVVALPDFDSKSPYIFRQGSHIDQFHSKLFEVRNEHENWKM